MTNDSMGEVRPEINNLPAEYREIAAICDATEVMIGGRMVLGIEDARALHTGILVGRDYTTWIKGRIAKYRFKEGVDYEVFTQTGENPDGGRPEKVYRLALQTAKEIAMVENNDRGRIIRRYYIWLEEGGFASTHARRSTEGPQTKSFDQWSAADQAGACRVLDKYEQMFPGNSEVIRWAAERVGFPMPPKHLMDKVRQGNLFGGEG